jgi:ubiquitin-activating enzyme E1 C
LVEFDEEGKPDPTTQIRLIDGGTEGFAGQARVIVPFESGCYECTMATLPPQVTFPMCTVRETPRLPEHCIQYAYVIEWENHFGKDKAVDKDSPDDITWIYEKAVERANVFGIPGVTRNLTLGVVKNIIPAIASTNALISAACVTECIKILTGCNNTMNNYMQYMGQTGVNTTTYVSQKLDDCMVCAISVEKTTLSSSSLLRDAINHVKAQFKLTKPGFMLDDGETLYVPDPPQLEQMHASKLDKTLKELQDEGILQTKQPLRWDILDKSVKGKMMLLITLQ